MRTFWHQGPQEDTKSTEWTQARQTLLKRMESTWENRRGNPKSMKPRFTKRCMGGTQSTEETATKQINLRWELFDTKAHKKTQRAHLACVHSVLFVSSCGPWCQKILILSWFALFPSLLCSLCLRCFPSFLNGLPLVLSLCEPCCDKHWL